MTQRAKIRILPRRARRNHIFITIEPNGYQTSIVRGWWSGHARALVLYVMGRDVRYVTDAEIRRGAL